MGAVDGRRVADGKGALAVGVNGDNGEVGLRGDVGGRGIDDRRLVGAVEDDVVDMNVTGRV